MSINKVGKIAWSPLVNGIQKSAPIHINRACLIGCRGNNKDNISRKAAVMILNEEIRRARAAIKVLEQQKEKEIAKRLIGDNELIILTLLEQIKNIQSMPTADINSNEL